MSLVENIFEDYFLYEVPHVNKRHVKNLIFRQIIRSEEREFLHLLNTLEIFVTKVIVFLAGL